MQADRSNDPAPTNVESAMGIVTTDVEFTWFLRYPQHKIERMVLVPQFLANRAFFYIK
jgi:hypothetical protein